MRRTWPVFIASVLIAIPGFAQRGGGHAGGGGHAVGGAAHASGSVGGRSGFSSAGVRSGGYRGGYSGGYRGGYRGLYGYGGFYFNPWLYGGFYNPYLWDTGWDYGNYGYASPDYGYADNSGYGSYGGPGYSSPSPSVLIISNQTPPPPESAVAVQAPSAWNSGPNANAGPNAQTKKYEEPLYIIAMKDGTIRAVLAYWVDGMNVHYVTMDHQQKQTPIASLDRGLSERLNRERNVAFQLPG